MSENYDDQIYEEDNELVDTEEEEKNYKGIIIALLVIGFIVGMIVLAIALITPGKVDYDPGDPYPFSMLTDNSMDPNLEPKIDLLEGDNGFIVKNQNATSETIDIMKVNDDGDITTRHVVDAGVMAGFLKNTEDFSFSPDGQYVLVKRTDGSYALYNLPNKLPLTDAHFKDGKLDHAEWLDDSSLVYVKENEVLYKSSPTDSLKSLTQSAEFQGNINGISDPTYTELMNRETLIWPSPDGSSVVIGSLNQTSQTRYKRSLEAATEEATPQLSLYVVPVASPSSPVKLLLPSSGFGTSVTWMDNSNVMVAWLASDRQAAEYHKCSTVAGVCEVNFSYTNDDLHWIGIYGSPVFNADASEFYLILPDPSNTRRWYRHVAAIKTDKSTRRGPEYTFLSHTSHAWSDTRIVGVYNNQLIYLTTGTNSTHQQLWRMNLTQTRQGEAKSECISCMINFDVICDYLDARKINDGKMIVRCLGPDVPTTHIVDLNKVPGKAKMILRAKYNAFKSDTSKVKWPFIQYVTIPQDGDLELNVKLHSPPVLELFQRYLYGLVIIVNDRPETQIVKSHFPDKFISFLSKNQSLIVAEVDLRGSSGRGERLRQGLHGAIGVREAQDIRKIVEYFQDHNADYKIDLSSVAVLGKGYGGFVAIHALRKEFVHCAIAVAPVTDLNMPEPYMLKRYNGGSTLPSQITYCSQQSGDCQSPTKQNLLLVHGTADKIVFYRHSLEMMRKLQSSGVEGLAQQVYPDIGHDITASSVRRHYYKTVASYIRQCFSSTQESAIER